VLDRPALATAGLLAAAAILFAPSWLGAPTRMTRQEVFKANPEFYDWYTGQPIVDNMPHDGGNTEGPENAPITIVEFSDFECPHCGRAHVTLKDVLPRFANEVRFVFHYFPLNSDCNDAIPNRGHEHACAAAVAAECAAAGGRFAVFANLLFAHQDALGSEALRGYAKQAGIDLAAFERCLKSSEAPAHVQADVEAGKRAGVRSTPTFFINGRKIEGNMPFDKWLMALAVELDKS
jgi:protein-disulfide isomerase